MTPTEALAALVAAVEGAWSQDDSAGSRWKFLPDIAPALAQAQAVLASGVTPQESGATPHAPPDRTTWPTREDYINAVWGVEGLSRQQAERIADILGVLHTTPEALAARIVAALREHLLVHIDDAEESCALIRSAIQETPR